MEWDALPGYYVLAYRSKGSDEFVISDPLNTTRYSIPVDNFDGEPIIRVRFNCNESGERCTSLGRFPYNFLPPAPPSTDPVSATPAPSPGAVGEGSHSSATRSSGSSEECTERLAENDWERWFHGPVVSKCTWTKITDSGAEGASSDAFTCPRRDRVNGETIFNLRVEVWIYIDFCYNSVDQIKDYTVESAGATLPERSALERLFIRTDHCGWVLNQSPSQPWTAYVTYNHWDTGELLPYWFGGWVQAKFATIVSREPIAVGPCDNGTASIDYLAAGLWVDYRGLDGIWGDG